MAISGVHVADYCLRGKVISRLSAVSPVTTVRKDPYATQQSRRTALLAESTMDCNHYLFRGWPMKDGIGHKRHPGRVYAGGPSRRWWLSDSSSNFGFSDSDPYGPYPWEEEDGDTYDGGRGSGVDGVQMEWVQEPEITLLTAEGAVKIGGMRSRRQVKRPSSSGRAISGRGSALRFREEDFMDPTQQLCLGALFDIAATNGLDSGRRFCVLGFCRSIEMLCTVVEDSVREQGGEIVVLEKNSSEGLLEKLHLTVALPLLWGVPPALDNLHYAIRTGGGIVDRMYNRWEFFG